MFKRIVSGIMLMLVLMGMLTFVFNIQPAKAGGTIYIRADGSVDPLTAPIQRDGSLYTLTENITSNGDGIVIERDNMTLDGSGYTVQGTGVNYGIHVFSRSNVTIKNIRIIAFYSGINLGYSSNNTVSHNTISNNSVDIRLYAYSESNTIANNNITKNEWGGIWLKDYCHSNIIANNTIENGNCMGVELSLSSHNNTIVGNKIANNNDYGIYFWDSSSNTIVGNNITGNNYVGIELENSSNSTIVGNNITTSDDGIGVQALSSSNCSISNNNLTSGRVGIYAFNSSSCSISNNKVTNSHCGFSLAGSSRNSLSGNTIDNALYSISIESLSDSPSLIHFIHSIDVSNLVDEKPVYYLMNQTDLAINSVTHPQIGYLALVNCANVTVEGLTMPKYVLLAYTNNSRIIGNSGFGISVQYSSSNVISRNNMTSIDYAVYFYNSSYNTLSENNITNSCDGILLRRSSYNVLRNNNLVNNTYNFGISTWALGFSHFINDVDTSNTVDGKTVYYWINHHNEQVPSDAGYIALVNSTNIIVKELELEHNVQSICLAYTTNSQIISNSITNNNVGVYLYESSFNNLSKNYLADNDFSIYSDRSTDNAVFRNNITNNYLGIDLIDTSKCSVSGNNVVNNDWGIQLLYSSNCSIFHNNICNNTYGISLSESSDNNWDDGYPSGGNCWSDYIGNDSYSGPNQNQTGSDGIGDTPYVIDGNNTDNYPLMGPWTNEGENVTVTASAEVSVTFESVTVGGVTTVNSSETGPDPPLGFVLVGHYYEIETTAAYSGKITIRIIYDDSNMTQEQEENLQLMQWDEMTQEWMDITTYIDTENNVIIGEASHLSMFGVTRALVLVNYVTITEVTPSKTILGEDYSVTINVTIANQGDIQQTFNITVYANDNTINSKNVTLASGNSTTITFTWNTTGFVKGKYTVSAHAVPVPGETATADNTLVADDKVCVSIPGDVDGDFDVDLYDAVKLLVVYGVKIDNPSYDPNCDIDGDGDIDLFDAVILLTHYGQKHP